MPTSAFPDLSPPPSWHQDRDSKTGEHEGMKWFLHRSIQARWCAETQFRSFVPRSQASGSGSCGKASAFARLKTTAHCNRLRTCNSFYSPAIGKSISQSTPSSTGQIDEPRAGALEFVELQK